MICQNYPKKLRWPWWPDQLWWLKRTWLPSGKRTNITMENHHAFHGKMHYFDWAIFNSYFDITRGYVHSIDLGFWWCSSSQTVSLLEGTGLSGLGINFSMLVILNITLFQVSVGDAIPMIYASQLFHSWRFCVRPHGLCWTSCAVWPWGHGAIPSHGEVEKYGKMT